MLQQKHVYELFAEKNRGAIYTVNYQNQLHRCYTLTFHLLAEPASGPYSLSTFNNNVTVQLLSYLRVQVAICMYMHMCMHALI